MTAQNTHIHCHLSATTGPVAISHTKLVSLGYLVVVQLKPDIARVIMPDTAHLELATGLRRVPLCQASMCVLGGIDGGPNTGEWGGGGG